MPHKSAMEQPTLDLLPLRVAVASYAMTPLQFEPGSKYQYSNAGINTAGRIIEVVSGMPYEEFMDKRLFAPLGMKDTTFWPDEGQIARLAKSYQVNSAKTDLEEAKVSQLTYPLERPQSAPDAGWRLVLHGQRLGPFLPDDPERWRLRWQTLCLGRLDRADDEQANRRVHQD